MPLTKAGKKLMSELKKEYGAKKGTGVFYALENKGTKGIVKKGKKK